MSTKIEQNGCLWALCKGLSKKASKNKREQKFVWKQTLFGRLYKLYCELLSQALMNHHTICGD